MRPRWSGLGRGKPNPVICGRKLCGKCGRWRLVVDFGQARVGVPGSYCRTCVRRLSAERYANITPAQMAAKRESGRFYMEGRRRRQGARVRVFKRRRTVIDRVERVLLPAAPLADEIRWWLSVRGLGPDEVRNQYSIYAYKWLAMRAGVSYRLMGRLLNNEQRYVRIDTADAIAVAMGIPLAIIYPDAIESRPSVVLPGHIPLERPRAP
jgi:hypothetical protein